MIAIFQDVLVSIHLNPENLSLEAVVVQMCQLLGRCVTQLL